MQDPRPFFNDQNFKEGLTLAAAAALLQSPNASSLAVAVGSPVDHGAAAAVAVAADQGLLCFLMSCSGGAMQ